MKGARLLTSLMLQDPVVQEANRRLEQLAAEQLACGDIEGFLVTRGRNNAPAALRMLDIRGMISDDQLRQVLTGVWSAAEFPLRCLPRRIWLAWFRRTGFLGPGGAPADPVEVWRSQVGRQVGLAWTTSEETARWFQKRNVERGFFARLLRGLAPAERLLAVIGEEGRGEKEVIVAPGRKFWVEVASENMSSLGQEPPSVRGGQ